MATWIFLRGLTREADHWGGFVDVFQHTLPQARVITLDLPGNGALHRQTSPLSITAMVEHCRTELARMGVQPPYKLLAMSMGAMVATQWACQQPQELDAAVLINTSFRPFNTMAQRLRPDNWASLLRIALLRPPALAIEREILRLTSNRPADHGASLADWLRIRDQRPVRTANAVRQLLAAARFKAATHAPAVPMLLLGSCQDHLVNVECTRTVARLWNCAVSLHPEAGHDLPLDDPQWVAQEVQQWLTVSL
jgi:pimeloyl-ACP methyl ester carboxylesterase